MNVLRPGPKSSNISGIFPIVAPGLRQKIRLREIKRPRGIIHLI